MKKTGLKNGAKVYPQLYFSGFGKGNKYTTDMTKLREDFNKLIQKYTITGESK